jgi:ornithine carbamoyltransferase
MPPEHFLDISDFDAETLNRILAASRTMKEARQGLPKAAREDGEPLKGRMLALLFERPSTRTRVSFEAAMRQLGGDVMVINSGDSQLKRGESWADTARVLSRYVDAIMIRASEHDHLSQLAAAASVPVINGLTDKSHPCQVMADVQTVEEKLGPLDKQTIAWVGDGNNVAASWIHAVSVLGGTLRLACPKQLSPAPEVLEFASGKRANLRIGTAPEEAVAGATCVMTDAWSSMHDKDTANRHNLLKPYQVNAQLLKKADANAIFMHCLPAHRGEEVTDEVMDGPQSAVFDQAENRLHAQKAILLHCFGVLK